MELTINKTKIKLNMNNITNDVLQNELCHNSLLKKTN